MPKPPKLNPSKLFKDVDYLKQLTDEERQWLWDFELKDKLGFGPMATKEDEKRSNAERYRQRSDWMNVPTDKIIDHIVERNERKRKIKEKTNEINKLIIDDIPSDQEES